MQMTPHTLPLTLLENTPPHGTLSMPQNKLGFVHPVSVSFVCIKHLMDSKRVLPMTLCA